MQVTLPHSGARVLLASDGLWDAVNPKTAAHHVRSLAATKAAKELVGSDTILAHMFTRAYYGTSVSWAAPSMHLQATEGQGRFRIWCSVSNKQG